MCVCVWYVDQVYQPFINICTFIDACVTDYMCVRLQIAWIEFLFCRKKDEIPFSKERKTGKISIVSSTTHSHCHNNMHCFPHLSLFCRETNRQKQTHNAKIFVVFWFWLVWRTLLFIISRKHHLLLIIRSIFRQNIFSSDLFGIILRFLFRTAAVISVCVCVSLCVWILNVYLCWIYLFSKYRDSFFFKFLNFDYYLFLSFHSISRAWERVNCIEKASKRDEYK